MSNTNGVDRIIRVVLGLALIAIAWAYMASMGTVFAVIIGIVGLVLVVTAAISWCPLYALFGISTRKAK